MFRNLKSVTIATALCATAVLSNAAGVNVTAGASNSNSSAISKSDITNSAKDESLARLVKTSIDQAMGSDGREISVRVNQGVATLSGWTNSSTQTAQARMLAYQVPGVVQSYSEIHTWSSRNH